MHTEIVKIGEVGATVDPSPAPSGVVNASIVEREIGYLCWSLRWLLMVA